MAAQPRLRLMLVTTALLCCATSPFAQSPPEPGQQPTLPQPISSASSEPSSEPAKTEKSSAPAKPAVPSCAVATVTAGPVRADGHPWDTLATEPPDIGIVEATTGATAQCDDTWSCS